MMILKHSYLFLIDNFFFVGKSFYFFTEFLFSIESVLGSNRDVVDQRLYVITIETTTAVVIFNFLHVHSKRENASLVLPV